MEEFRSLKISTLVRILDELEMMALSIGEIETVLKTCGLNADCAIRFGASIRSEKENSYNLFDSLFDGPAHP
jgi:hypothetical protein